MKPLPAFLAGPAAGFLALQVLAADLPPPVLPAGVGVNIHFNRGHEADLDLIAAAGIKVVRMDLGWAGIERQKGRYDWSAYDELTANLEKRGLQPLYILDYSNPLYEETVLSRNPVTGQEQRDTASPQRPESVAAFARWAAAAAERYRGRRVIWEIWNEPNISFWKPKPDVAQYNTLALATCRAIRAADPAATLIGPATSEIPLQFLEDHFACGILEYLDGVSVHPYRNYAKPPETAAAEYLARRLARNNTIILAEAIRQGYHVVTTEPAAAVTLTREYPQLLEDEDSRLVARNTSDLGDYLWRLHLSGRLQLDFKPITHSLGYHQPCRLRALGKGAPGAKLIQLIPGLNVVRTYEACSGMAGTYGLMRENFRTSLRVGWGLINMLRDSALECGVTECSTCKIQMEQGTTKPTLHPIKLLAAAYGLFPGGTSRLFRPSRELTLT